ncbi:sugar kinase [Paraglaciecola aquimarina]|uniref:Sugar kinase n=1 Tax=Paraglaciecola aquimarina TaxID=1235557 RepID=A0ABU3SYS0_9ALTE|nr:sugar kinase [Paraglaciecola aquimarina]MDU0355145.1 sugar kinase [Paraglaciecola aquimarina]
MGEFSLVMQSLLVIGECMMELSSAENGDLQRSFAGDTYNSAIYAKRCLTNSKVSFLSAIGVDAYSQKMKATWQAEGIDTSLLVETDQAEIGIYAIHTDDSGERSFSYWRKGSAASKMMQYLDVDKLLAAAKEYQMVYFSGISLAILSDEDKGKFIDCIEAMSKQGCKIAFDPNYRPRLWDSLDHALLWLEKAYSLSDLILPGLEDHEVMFGHEDHQQMAKYFEQYATNELVIKCGSQGTFVYVENELVVHQPFKPAPIQVDSTAAGDSFAGTYIGKRIEGSTPEQALTLAAHVAGQVVQHKGAILDAELYKKLCLL